MSPTPIPPPRLRYVHNDTPFPHFQYDKMGPGRRFHDVVILCASFGLENGRLKPSSTHRGPVFADDVWDAHNANVSSLRSATDLVLTKPGSDVYVTGTVRTLEARPQREWAALLRIERNGHALMHKLLRFTGPRWWRAGWLGWSLSAAQATVEVPLRYELAYGGWWYHKGDRPEAQPRVCKENPSGTGWFGSADRRHHKRARYEHRQAIAAPQIEYVSAPIRSANQRSRVAGYGPIARHWAPRYRYAGTYDAAWLNQLRCEAVPDYPCDYDTRYFHYAPADQIVHVGLVGDEELQMAGVFDDRPALCASLPHIWMEAVCHPGSGAPEHEAMRLDTVHIDLDARQVHLTWRLTLEHMRDIIRVELFDRLIADGHRTQAAFRSTCT